MPPEKHASVVNTIGELSKSSPAQYLVTVCSKHRQGALKEQYVWDVSDGNLCSSRNCHNAWSILIHKAFPGRPRFKSPENTRSQYPHNE